MKTLWRLVTVSGPSMVPTLRHGDTVVARPGARVRPGDVVLARFADMPDRLVIKRADRALEAPETGWWLTSDNSFAGGDSETHGAADVEARAVLVIRRGRPRRIARGRPRS